MKTAQFRIQNINLYDGTFTEKVVTATDILHALVACFNEEEWLEFDLDDIKPNGNKVTEFIIQGEEQLILIKEL